LDLHQEAGGRVLTAAACSPEAFEIAHLQATRYAAMSDSERDVIGKGFAAAKMANAMAFLRTRYRPGLNELLARIEQLQAALHGAASIESVRGYEAQAARLVFSEIRQQIEVPEFRFAKRERSEPDCGNALFNFGYYLLFLHLNLEIRALGLNPYLGFLHRRTTGQRYESLVCDVQELFRPYVDRLLVRLINLKAVRAEDFDTAARPIRMGRETLRTLALHFERELARRLPEQSLSLGEAISAQCVNLKRYVCEGSTLYFHTWATPKRAKPVRTTES